MSEVQINVKIGSKPNTVTIIFTDLVIDDIDEVFAELGTVEGRNRFADGIVHSMTTGDTEGRF